MILLVKKSYSLVLIGQSSNTWRIPFFLKLTKSDHCFVETIDEHTPHMSSFGEAFLSALCVVFFLLAATASCAHSNPAEVLYHGGYENLFSAVSFIPKEWGLFLSAFVENNVFFERIFAILSAMMTKLAQCMSSDTSLIIFDHLKSFIPPYW